MNEQLPLFTERLAWPGKDWSFRACSQPIRLRGTQVHVKTGEIRELDFERRCGTRRSADCAACADIWKGDAFHTLMAGAKQHAGELTFITLTAPGWQAFGHTHTASHSGATSERCACRRFHKVGDACIGLPVNARTFDYVKVAAFNSAAPRLTTLTMQKVWRLLGGDKMPTARVMEWQSRGVLHAHVLVLGHVPRQTVLDAVLGRDKVGRSRAVRPATHKGWSWGAQVDVRHIQADAGRELVNYVLKVVDYAIKDVTAHVPDSDPGTTLRRFVGRHHAKLREAGENTTTCTCTKLECRHGWTHTGGTAESAIVLAGVRTARRCRRHKRAAAQYGFTGNVLSMNRSWGATLREARERRGEFQRSHGGTQAEPLWRSLGWQVERVERPASAGRLEPVKKLVTQFALDRPEPVAETLLRNGSCPEQSETASPGGTRKDEHATPHRPPASQHHRHRRSTAADDLWHYESEMRQQGPAAFPPAGPHRRNR